ncbi:MAG TPA: hypothetical protein VF092_19010 [Longimicrobium sp.]
MRLLRLSSFLIAISPVAALAQQQADAPGDWRALLGCYRQGDWRFALDSIPFIGVHNIEPESRLLRSSHDWDDRYETYWRMIAPDSVKLVLDDGLHGVRYRLAVRGDTLTGREQTVTDIAIRIPVRKFTAVREACPAASTFPSPKLDSATVADWWAYGALLPSEERLAADPWRAVAPVAAWLRAHPDALRRWSIRWNARVQFRRAADADVRANARELAGTYRLEVERTGGPTQVFYGRTEIRPRFALRPADTALIVQERPAGYQLRFTLSRDSTRLPRPGPGIKHRDAFGASYDASNSTIDVRFPGTVDADGTRRFRGYVMLVNFAAAFRDADPEISRWEYEWYRQSYRSDAGVNEYAEIVVSPDGRVTFTQREELGPDRVVTFRGERISGVAWECTGYQC